MRLDTQRHDRDASGMTYVYPVVSRRARGVSVGINLNTNNACNWRCGYCQVPGLTRGAPGPVDLDQLERELGEMLEHILRGDFLERRVPEGSRRLNDVAFSGNGEPTSAAEFPEAVARVRDLLAGHAPPEPVKLVLITNGSLVHQPRVQAGLHALDGPHAQVWFKLDSATDEGLAAMNDAHTRAARQEQNLVTCAGLAPTWVQTMALARHGEAPEAREQDAYLALLERLLAQGVPLRGVLLYGLARTSHQPEAAQLSALPEAWMRAHAERIRALDLPVELSL